MVVSLLWISGAICLAGMLLPAPALGAQDSRNCPPAVEPLTADQLQAAVVHARDRGLLWRITRDGRASYLYGTLHVGKAAWMMPGPMVRHALEQTDTTALELDPLDGQVQRDIAATIAARPATNLPAALQARLAMLWDQQCLPIAALDSGPVELHAFTLMFMIGRRDGFDPAYGTEVMLAALAHDAGRAVVSLETAASQLNALLARDAAEAQEIVQEALDDLEADRPRDVLRKSARVWEAADLAAFDRYREWCGCYKSELDRRLMKRVLEDRNPGLAQRIDALHSEGRRIFAAVGTMHMVGPSGLPALLAQRGYRVERLR